MARHAIKLSLLLLASCLFWLAPVNFPVHVKNNATTSTPAATYILKQGFETASPGPPWDNGETWASAGAGYVAYYSPSLDGTNSIVLNGTVATSRVTSPTFTGLGELWIYCMVRMTNIHSTSGSRSILYGRASTSSLLNVLITEAGLLNISAGGTSGNTTDAMSVDTTYHLWVYYKKGTGSDGIITVGFSTDGTKPTSGNKYVELTTSTLTSDLDNIRFEGSLSTTGDAFILDKVRLDDVNIGDSPE